MTQIRRTTLLIAFSVAIVCGVASATVVTYFDLSLLITCCLLVVVTMRRRNIVTLLCVLALGLVMGNWRGAFITQKINAVEDYYGTTVVMLGVAQNDGTYANNGQLSFDIGQTVIVGPDRITVPGQVQIQGFGANAVFRGDYVVAEGVLQDTRGSRQGRLSFADITVRVRHQNLLEDFRHRFIAGIHSALPEPQASLGIGLLIGDKTGLPKSVLDSLQVVGLTHIIAVSGYNLTIIVSAVRRALRNRSKYQATALSLLLIGTFVLLTGFSASIVRAAIVSMLSICAWYYGRTIRPVLLISFAAAVTALWNPLYVWSDVGWHLSFLAFYGVLVLAPLILKRLPRKLQMATTSPMIIESLCAQLMTVPYILFVFRQVSLAALPLNLIIVPLVPMAMLLTLIAGVAGMIVVGLAGWVAWPAKILLLYIVDVVTIAARIPHASVQRVIGVSGLILAYSSIALVGMAFGKATMKHGTITDTDN